MTALSGGRDQWGDALVVRVTPKASSSRIVVDAAGRVRVYVTCAPEDGKANKEVIKLLAKALGLPKTALSIRQGHTSRDKIIALDWE